MEKERDDAIADKDEVAAYVVDVEKECFLNAIEQIRVLNPNLELFTKGI